MPRTISSGTSCRTPLSPTSRLAGPSSARQRPCARSTARGSPPISAATIEAPTWWSRRQAQLCTKPWWGKSNDDSPASPALGHRRLTRRVSSEAPASRRAISNKPTSRSPCPGLPLAMHRLSHRDPNLYSLQVFTNVLGGGMSSRLFQEVREQRGLCYAIYAFHAPYSDIGMFGLYAGTDAADVAELMRVVVGEINAAGETINEAEVARAKAQMKAGLLMALESSSARAEQLARQLFNWGRPVPLDELVEKIEAVTVESARAAGRALIARGRPAVAALG